MNACSVALIVNPVAGMGGALGLKGTDGELAARARAAGAPAVAAARTAVTLSELAASGLPIHWLTAAGDMGAEALRAAGFVPKIVYTPTAPDSSAEDTRLAAQAMLELEPALLLFAGGDGTARDLHEVVGQRLPVLGIPAGVKMHSGVFAASARAAARVAGAYLRAEARDPMLADSEVLDRDPQDVDGASSPQLFGLLKTPYLASLSPGAKASNRFSGESAVAGALQRVVDTVRDERLSLIGPGSTMLALKRRLGLRGSPLGVDAIAGYRPVGEDLDEERILSLLCDRPARLVMGVVGGQGFLFGRGNQQLGPRVLRQIGAEHTIVVASVDKLAALSAGCLLLDTGDEQLDREFARFLPVRVSYRRTVMMPVRGASSISGG